MSDVSPGDVKDTAKQQARRVGTEAKVQARTVAADARDRISDQARTQNGRLVTNIRQTADHLDEMRGVRQDTPAARVVSQVADGGRQLADYLERNGPEGVLREVQDFARRRPGAFLATALAAGFVVGRLGKGVAKAEPNGKPATDSFVSGGGDSTGAAPTETIGRPDSLATAAGDPGYSTGAAPTESIGRPDSLATPAGDPGYATDPGYAAGTAGYPATGLDEPTRPTDYNTTEYASTGTGRPVPVDGEYPPVDPEVQR